MTAHRAITKQIQSLPFVSSLFIVGGVVSIICVAVTALVYLKQQEKVFLRDSMQAVMGTTRDALSIWIEDQFDELEMIVEDESFKELASQILQGKRTAVAKETNDIENELRSHIQPWIDKKQALNYFLCDKNGHPLSSSFGDNFSLDFLRATDCFGQVLGGERCFIPPHTAHLPITELISADATGLFFLLPVRDASDSVIAVLALQADSNVTFNRFPEFVRFGKSGDFYLISEEGTKLTPGRFDESILQVRYPDRFEHTFESFRVVDPGEEISPGFVAQQSWETLPLTRLAKDVLQRKNGMDLVGYRDYRGVQVVGVWEWDSDYKFGLAYEIDYAEAYSSYNKIYSIILALSSILTGVGLVLIWVGAKRNTELVKKSNALALSEEKFRNLGESIGDAVVLVDEDLVIQFWNNNAELLFGYTKEEVLNKKIHNIFPRISAETEHITRSKSRELLDSADKTRVTETEVCNKKSECIPVDVSLSSFLMEEVQWYIYAFRDITERKKTEADFRRNEQLLRESQRFSNLGHWEVNYLEKSRYWSEELFRIFELSPKDGTPSRRKFLSLLHPDDRKDVKIATQKSAEPQFVHDSEFRLLLPDGRIKHIHARGVTTYDMQGAPINSFGTMQDVSGRKQLELEALSAKEEVEETLKKLMHQEERYRSLVAHIPGAVYRLEKRDGWIVTYLSDYFEKITGYPVAEFLHHDIRNLSRIIHEEDRDATHDVIKQHFIHNENFETEYRIVTPSGRIRWVMEMGNLSDEWDSSIIDGFIMDISDRVEKLQQLEDVMSRLKLATEGGRIGIWDWDIVKDELYWDAPMFSMYRVKRNDFIDNSRMWARCLLEEDLENYQKVLQKVLKGETETFDIALRIKLPDDRIGHIRSKGKAICDNSGSPVRILGVSYDITESIVLQSELKELNKELESRIVERTKELERAKRAALSLMQDADSQRKRAEQTLLDFEKSQKDLVASETRFRGLVENIEDVIWEYDKDWFVVYVSPTCEKVLGYTQEELIGMRGGALMHPDDIEMMRAKYEEAIEKKRSLRGVQFRFIHKYQKAPLYLETNMSPHYSDDGTFLGLRGVSRNVTSRKAADEKILKLSSSVEASPVSVVITDTGGNIEYVNRKFCDVTGYSTEEVLGQNPRILKSGHHSPTFYAKMWQALETGGEWHGDICNKKKDGTLFWERNAISPIRQEDGAVTHYVAIKEDITENIKAKQLLQEALENAEAATMAKSEFLANMSHEIRTPMNAIIGMTYLAMKTELNTRQKNYLATISNSAKTLLGIINDILDISKIEAGKLELEETEFNLDEVMEPVLAGFASDLAAKGVEFLVDVSLQIPTVLIGDPLRIKQIFTNLLSNAVKFTTNGEVGISIDIQKKDSEEVVLECIVNDTGIGINEEQCTRLFEKFNQADTSTTRKYGGTGLGLSICKQLIDMMEGYIQVESFPGQGTMFVFTLPLKHRPDRRKNPLTQALTANLQNLRVLLLEKNSKAQQSLTRKLEQFSNQITCVTTRDSAELRIQEANAGKQPFDLYIFDFDTLSSEEKIDLHSPEFAKILDLPRLIITATTIDYYSVEEVCKSLDFNGVIKKPVSYVALHNAIVGVFGVTQLAVGKRREFLPQAERAGLQAIQGSTVLLVEDNAVNQDVACELLKSAGLQVALANNGQEAVDILKKEKFDLVLMDIQMPVMDGITAAKKIREGEPPGEHLPIIAMTAHAMIGDKEKSVAAGMDDHLTKPINPEELNYCIVKWISGLPAERLNEFFAEEPVETAQLPCESLLDVFPARFIDIRVGLTRVAGNEKVFFKLLKDFSEEGSRFVSVVEHLLKSNDIEAAHRSIHTMKGLAGTIGALALQESCQQLELEITGDGNNVSEESFYNAKDRLEEVLHEIDSFMTSHEESDQDKAVPADVKFDAELVANRLETLEELLEIGDMDAERVFVETRKMLYKKFYEDTASMEKAMDSLDFKKVLACVRRIQAAMNG